MITVVVAVVLVALLYWTAPVAIDRWMQRRDLARGREILHANANAPPLSKRRERVNRASDDEGVEW